MDAQQGGASRGAGAELPLYKSHKTVHALKIAAIEFDNAGAATIARVDGGPVFCIDDFRTKFKGSEDDLGYYVQYADGYASWSPTKAFEDGYTAVSVASTSDARTINNVMRHSYRVLSDHEKSQMKEIKDAGANFIFMLEDIGGKASAPGEDPQMASRELSISQQKIEEAVMWAVKHITR